MKAAINFILVVALTAVVACGSDDNTNTTVKAPTDLKVAALEGGAHLTWKDNSDNESGFMIERMSGSSEWATIGNVPFDTTQYHDPSLTAGAAYTYRVMAMPKSGGHETGSGAYSNEVTCTAVTAQASDAAGAPASSHSSGGAPGGHG
ncbi:MAG: hypothetical protein RL701_6075 [Pseudomonadota bacterium]